MKPVVYLSLEERLKVACYHNAMAIRPNWVLDTDTGHMVCSGCAKPAPDLVLRICAECQRQFVLELEDPDWEPKMVFVSALGQYIEKTFWCPPCY